jgi:hypothetical protein
MLINRINLNDYSLTGAGIYTHKQGLLHSFTCVVCSKWDRGYGSSLMELALNKAHIIQLGDVGYIIPGGPYMVIVMTYLAVPH